MDDLVGYLSSEPPALTNNGKLMVTSAVACLSFDSMKDISKPGKGRLECLLRPRDIFK